MYSFLNLKITITLAVVLTYERDLSPILMEKTLQLGLQKTGSSSIMKLLLLESVHLGESKV